VSLGYGDFYDTFARFYDDFRAARDGEEEYYVAAARRGSGGVLELGCGTGRILVPMASVGIECWGIDASEAMLAVLAAKLARLGLAAELRRADMRDFALERVFGLVTIPYHTFQHLLREEDQRGCLECVRRHLAPGGRLVLDVAGFDPASLGRRRGPVRLERPERLRDPDFAGDLETVFSAEIDPASGRAVQTRTLRRGAETLLEASTEVKYLREGEIEGLLAGTGFRVVTRAGGFHGEPFAQGGEQVWVAELA
jgi:SAM-dependent methyltransferase